MTRHAFLMLCLLVTSIVAATTVHAQELSGASVLECSGMLHSDGDPDQSQGNADQATPHHHGSCHGGTFLLVKAAPPMGARLAGCAHPMADFAVLPGWSRGPDLHPPIT